MKYMLLIYGDEKALSQGAREDCYKESAALAREIAGKGQFVSASPLHLTNMATSVRMREGKALITDGPFAETHEQLGGYYMVDVPNLDEALAIAKRIPGARWGTVEVRPIMEIEGLPDESEDNLAAAVD